MAKLSYSCKKRQSLIRDLKENFISSAYLYYIHVLGWSVIFLKKFVLKSFIYLILTCAWFLKSNTTSIFILKEFLNRQDYLLYICVPSSVWPFDHIPVHSANCISCREVSPLPPNTTHLKRGSCVYVDEAPVLELLGVWNTLSLPLILSPLWPRMVAPIRVPSMDQMDLSKNYSYINEKKNPIKKQHKKFKYGYTMDMIP